MVHPFGPSPSTSKQGYAIAGDPSTGLQLQPALWAQEEIEAILLGLSWVIEQDDEDMAPAAADACAKIAALLPPPAARPRDGLLIDVSSPESIERAVHAAIQSELAVFIAYRDAKGKASARHIWPILLYEFWSESGAVFAWCETRNDFRNFRLDPTRRQLLLARFQLRQDGERWY